MFEKALAAAASPPHMVAPSLTSASVPKLAESSIVSSVSNIPSLIEERLRAAFNEFLPGADPIVRRSVRADFQANGVLALAKKLGGDPRELANSIVESVDLDDICSSVDVSGGFINMTIRPEFLAHELLSVGTDERLGIPRASNPEVAVVDYSAPNVAKEMHVGHLRSTIIGDSIVRILEFAGHDVIRENHVGDWGTPFGMLIENLIDIGEAEGAAELSMGDLNLFYQQARSKFESDPEFAERSRARVVALQSGDPGTMRLWHILVDQSAAYFLTVYERLGVLLTEGDSMGESAYNSMLPEVVSDLDRRGLLVESDGAMCVFPPGYSNREGEPLPLIVQKADGGFGYAATDLATVRDRIDRLHATWLIYCVGAPQAQHLQMVWKVAEMAGWLRPPARAVHVANGNVLGEDGKILRTRSGTSLRLIDLLDEAVQRARLLLESRGTPEGIDVTTLSRQIGIGALKYADLSTDRQRDYQFDWERMLSFDGNTAPYLQYAHARIQSIFTKGGTMGQDSAPQAMLLNVPAERELALKLLDFEDAYEDTLSRLSPHRLCVYLFELAATFTHFYENCPVLSAPAGQQEQRLFLCSVTARTLRTGLNLLGIEAPTRM